MTLEITNAPATAPRDVTRSAMRGWSQRCPACGAGRLYDGYLKVVPACGSCGEEMHHQRADDAPPYFTMFIVGHVVIGGVLALEQAMRPEIWIHLALWVPLTIGLSLWLLPRIKGLLIGYQWALRMHGFGGPASADPAEPEPATVNRV